MEVVNGDGGPEEMNIFNKYDKYEEGKGKLQKGKKQSELHLWQSGSTKVG